MIYATEIMRKSQIVGCSLEAKGMQVRWRAVLGWGQFWPPRLLRYGQSYGQQGYGENGGCCFLNLGQFLAKHISQLLASIKFPGVNMTTLKPPSYFLMSSNLMTSTFVIFFGSGVPVSRTSTFWYTFGELTHFVRPAPLVALAYWLNKAFNGPSL